MNFFRRKFGAKAATRQKTAHNDADLAADSRRVTLSLSHAGKFAAMLAHSRASAVMEVSDVLAGMYISDWEHLSQYWEEEDLDQVEELLRKICQISPQRWNSWIEQYGKENQDGVREQPWRGKKPTAAPPPAPLQRSVALEDVLRQAEQIAPFRDSKGEQRLPILTNETVLLCIARSYGTEISRSLAASGLNTPKLERDALFPRHGPLV